MKTILLFVLVVVISASAQEIKKEPVSVPSNYNEITRVENGETEIIKCKIISVSKPHLIVMIDDPDYHAKQVWKAAYNDYVTESDNYKNLVIEDYPKIETAAVGQKDQLYVKRVGTIVKSRNGRPAVLELWSCAAATAVTSSSIETQNKSDEINRRLEAEARNKAEAKRTAQQARVEQGKVRALQLNQEAAAKGDAYGLLRMGERYQNGDGVEKDLTKAREYLQKADDAGSSTAKDKLSKLEAK